MSSDAAPSSRVNPALSVIIPVYNERESLPELLRELQAALDDGSNPEFLFVDDGSSDGSDEVLLGLLAKEPRMRVLRHSENCGQSAAFASGFAAARAPVIVTLDADLQNDPADIPRLLEALEGADIVSGVRARRQDTWLRRVSSRVANRVRSALLRDGIRDVGCSLKAFRRPLLEELPIFDGLHRFLPALVQMRGARTREIEVRHRQRRHGTSSYNVRNRLVRGIVDLLGVRWLQRRSIAKRDCNEVRM